MTEHDDHEDEAEEGRTTAPKSDYTGREIAIGAVVALVGLLVVFGIPFLLA
jgi:hypothetical protein